MLTIVNHFLNLNEKKAEKELQKLDKMLEKINKWARKKNIDITDNESKEFIVEELALIC